jgi:hypothetical protein
MTLSSLLAGHANEYARRCLLIRPDPVAREAHGTLSAIVDQEHRVSLPFRGPARAHGVSRQKRAKPPCLIPLKGAGRTVESPRELPSQFTADLAGPPTQRRSSQRGPNVAQRGPTRGSPATGAVPPTSPPGPDTIPEGPDAPLAVGSPEPRSPGGSDRFMLSPSGVPH